MSLNFKIIDKVDDFVRGPVLSTALVGGHTEDHKVQATKALDIEPFIYTSSIKSLITAQVAKIKVTLDTISSAGEASFTALGQSLLIGPVDSHLKFDVGADTFVIYDAISNTIFDKYTVGDADPSCIYVNAEDIKGKTLLYRTEESISPQNGFVKFTKTYSNYTTSYNTSTSEIEITLNADGSETPSIFPNGTSVEI